MLCEKCGTSVSDEQIFCGKCQKSIDARGSKSNSGSMTEKQFYSHSGKIAPQLVLGVPVLLFVSILLAFAYAYSVVYIPIMGYLSFLLTIGFALGVGFSTAVILQFFKTRNTFFSLCFGIVSGLFALYAAWVTFEYVFLNKVTTEEIELLQVAKPKVLWNVACLIAEKGWYSIRSMTPKGIVLWSFWGLEACVVVGVPAYMTHSFMKDNVFCETCSGWTDDHKGKLIFEYLSETELKQKLTIQDMSFLDDTLKVKRTAESFYRIDCSVCCTCNNLYTLSLLRVTRTWDEKGNENDKESYIMKNLFISKETFDKLTSLTKSAPSAIEEEKPAEVAIEDPIPDE